MAIQCSHVVLFILATSSFVIAGDEPSHSPLVDGVSAPVGYKGQLLVLTHEKGVAAIVFGDEIKNGVKYRYRYLPKEGKEESGNGEVFEKYKRSPGDKTNVTILKDDGSQLNFKAGPAKVEWSYNGEGKGMIYYRPEYVKVQIANADDFEKLNLKRFMK